MDTAITFTGETREPTGDERTFAAVLDAQLPGMSYRLRSDPDGAPWLLVVLEMGGGGTTVTLRLDYDASGLRAGWGPASDDQGRAESAGVDVTSLDGLKWDSDGSSPEMVALLAVDWFESPKHNSAA
ncbi:MULTISPECIES: hypothetical protein [Actinosynnema]|uniref:hypothetical protein n=1 Tax=Actinosynnema TaxID=40566 RepID=UPI0020A2CDD5|nr:hypothetical protein [Actinosynnema pretiosum]MCP2096426.1 hypothetical protein [Actinosynnema pretiosum]